MPLPQPSPRTYTTIKLLNSSNGVIRSDILLMRGRGDTRKSLNPLRDEFSQVQGVQGSGVRVPESITYTVYLKVDPGDDYIVIEDTLEQDFFNAEFVLVNDRYKQRIAGAYGISQARHIGGRGASHIEVDLEYIPRAPFFWDIATGVDQPTDASMDGITIQGQTSAFTQNHKGKVFVWSGFEEVQVVGFTSASQLTADRPQTIVGFQPYQVYNALYRVLTA